MGAFILWAAVSASVLGGVVGSVLVALAWRYRERPAMSGFGWLMLVCSLWALLSAGRMTAGDAESVHLFDLLIRIVSSSVGPLLLVFVVAYTGNEDALTPVTLGALFLFPVVYWFLSLTAPIHGLASGLDGVSIVTQHGVTVGMIEEGIASGVESVYNYLAITAAFALLFRFLLRSRAIYRRQAAIVGIGALIPVSVDIGMKLASLSHPGVDLTPASLGVMGIVLGWGLFRHDFLDVTPLASDILVSELPDPVFVLDGDGRILDHNHAAETVFDEPSLGGRQIDAVAPGLSGAFDGNSTYSRSNPNDTGITYFDPRVTVIEDQHDIERGRLVVLRNVTEQQRRQDRLEALQAATQQFITADSMDRVAELTVTFANRVLDQDAAAVYVYDEQDDALSAIAASDELTLERPIQAMVVDDHDHPIFRTYDEGSIAIEYVDQDEAETAFPHLMLVAIGDHGVLMIGSDERDAFVTEDEQFATILARTTEVALSQVEHERELRQSRRSIERRNEQVEFFDGVLRHTLRNALLVIEGRAEHLRDHVDDARERHLDRIVQWCEDLADLSEEIEAINDTVTASEARRLDTIDLGTVIRDRLDHVTDDSDDVTIDLDVEDDLTVRANDLVEKVVDSVVSNAIAHNDDPDPRVEITALEIADRVQLRVADNGPGMTEEMKETVFERDVGTSQTSHGFGLYFVSVMMNLYGGTVWIEDNADTNGRRPGAVAVLEFQQAETQHTSQSAENGSA